MDRSVACRMDVEVTGPADVYLSVALSATADIVDEHLQVTLDGDELAMHEIRDDHGTRLHCARGLDPGRLEIEYRASSTGRAAPAPVTDVEAVRYLRPSRYCESDTLAPTAASEFAGLSGLNLLNAVIDWVNRQLTYVSGSSLPTDGAVRTLLGRQGVCRDFAHLSVALLRSLNVPARLAAVYAPGLSPMEFHAVAEALVDGQWWVVDATELAPRQSLLRVATGRDAADTAFLTNFGANTTLTGLEVTAVVDRFELDNTQLLTQLR
jgi:transglutaminase-like putative cysteine protease